MNSGLPLVTPSAPPESPERQEDFRYWGFISYSHRDAKWAEWLHHELETYRIPRSLLGRPIAGGGGAKIPARLLPIFRDRDELPGASDLGERLREVLRVSRSLIVICSPASARSRWVNEEIRIFKALGRSDRVFSLVVDGSPGSGDENSESFPSALRFRLAQDGTTLLTDQPVEVLAADARPNADGKTNAKLKLIAGILNVGFDDLKQRERRRRMRRRIQWSALGAVAALGLAVGYICGVDAGLRLPGANALQHWLDANELTFFRPVHPMPVIHDAAVRLRLDLYGPVRNSFAASGWLREDFHSREENPVHGAWAQAQAVCGLLRSPDVPPEELRELLPFIEVMFDSSSPAYRGEHGWLGDPSNATPQAEPALWLSAAMAIAWKREGVVPGEERSRYLSMLEQVHRTLRVYGSTDGGWNMYPIQKKPSQHNNYTTAMALLALLETRAAGLPWDGSEARRDELIRMTATWLMDRYHNDEKDPGWGEGETGTDNANATIDGLTLQIFAELLRAEAEAGIAIYPHILEDIPEYLEDTILRGVDYPVEKGEFMTKLLDPDGTEWKEPKHETINFLWYPWAVDAGSRWLSRANRLGAPIVQRMRVQRALGRLVVDIGPDLITRAKSRWIFVAAEPLYGLSTLPKR